ncbi:MAG: molybdenum cofactor synthesis domain-containing protein [Acidobacteria bacterium OLB17]|nr:MAG: molybdenum cofactor synthesis domain-containing protein [Acidobacteria bacterium OLB17]
MALKPGKPVIAAWLGKTLIFSLPGNPVSAAVTFQLFVRAAIVGMQGVKHTALRASTARLADSVKAAKDRRTLTAGRLVDDSSGKMFVIPLRGKGSSDLVSFANAEVLIDLAMGSNLQAGTIVPILFL